jgi:magnesium transporter
MQRRTSPGASPGAIQAHPDAEQPTIRVIAYDSREVIEQSIDNLADIPALLAKWPVSWINVDGLGSTKTVRELGDLFGIHPLALEDVVNVHQRAKVEDFETQLFIVVRMGHSNSRYQSEQMSLFVGENYVLTFQERAGDCFDPVRQRIRGGRGRIRTRGPDYLAYALIDAGVDSYFPILMDYGDRLDELEDEITLRHVPGLVERIHELRGELRELSRDVRPHRDAIGVLIRDEHPLISEETRVFLRDCADHAYQLDDLLNVYREFCAELRDYYLSNVSNRMNETMKVLTIIATIFIPLSFVAGLYGMNFDTSSPWNMPELGWRYGYPVVLAGMVAIAGALLWFFRHKGWLGE